MNPEYFRTEGFKLRVIKDIGWPFSSDKYCCECRYCHMGPVFMLIDEPHEPDEMLLPVCEHCFEDAKAKYETAQTT